MKARVILPSTILIAVLGLMTPAANATPTEAEEGPATNEALATDYPTADDAKRAAIMDPLVEELSRITGSENSDVELIDGEPNGYAGFSVDYDKLRVDLYWVGDLPATLKKLIDAHPDVEVVPHAASYTQREMIEARDHVVEQREAVKGTLGELLTVGPDYQGRGLKIRTASEVEIVRTEATSALKDITSVPVFSIESRVDGLTTFAGGRQNDTTPHYGGAGVWITNQANTYRQYCTTGASVEGNSTGNKYMTTAIHCMEYPGSPDTEIDSEGLVFNSANTQIGSWRWVSSQLQKDRHAILIKLKSSSTNSGRAYWGAYNSITSSPWAGATTSPIGSSVCTLGANTGAHCGGVVTDTHFTLIHGPASIVNMVEAKHSTQALAGSGDSGGPVNRTVSGEHKLAGFILGAPSSASSNSACSSSRYLTSTNVMCSKTVWYTGGVSSYLDSLGISLR